VKIISACLNPVERGLFTFKGCWKIIPPRILKFLIEVSMEFIRQVRDEGRNYFHELEEEYCYFQEQYINQNAVLPTRFMLIKNYSEIEGYLNDREKDTLSVFFSIEGCHVFNNGGLENSTKDQTTIEKRIQKVKEWPQPPLYISLAHMVNNELCGHAKSLPSRLAKIIGQDEGMDESITETGEIVLHKLLDPKPRRIYIDIKHMNVKSRKRYYEILESDEKYDDKCIPILVSHGAVFGQPSKNETEEKEPYCNIKSPFQNERDLKFYEEEINIYDKEIIRIEKTGGFLGIMLDERRLSKEKLSFRKKRKKDRGEQLHYQAGLVWKQIRYIAEVLDRDGKFGWATATIGSDYDGLVDPPDGYWTSADFGILEENLIHHADEYLNCVPSSSFICPENAKLSASEIIELFMRGNAQRFLKNFLRDGEIDKADLEIAVSCKEAKA
jgi:hypothetical protein